MDMERERFKSSKWVVEMLSFSPTREGGIRDQIMIFSIEPIDADEARRRAEEKIPGRMLIRADGRGREAIISSQIRAVRAWESV